MATIPLTKAHQFWPLTGFLRSTGVSVGTYIERFHLPPKMLDAPEIFIDESRFWVLASAVARREGMLDWGFQAGRSIDMASLGDFGRVLMRQPTLKASLDTFIESIRAESLFSDFELMQQNDQFWFVMHQRFNGEREVSSGLSIIELYNLQFLLKLVRSAVGKDWLPAAVHLQSGALPADFDPSRISTGTIRFSSTVTGFAIPAKLLSTPMQSTQSNSNTGQHECGETVDFPTTLKLLLEGYLDESLTIHQCADLVGTSSRTLQRRLAEHSTSFNEVLDQIRFDVAKQLLLDETIPISDVCYEVGYNDPGNFTRAFRRWAGVSPREHRQLHVG